MRKIKSFLTLIRLPNVIFIFLTQILVYHFIIIPYNQEQTTLNTHGDYFYYLLALSTTLVAAAGYIINDYFDTKIDEINKPRRVTVEKVFKRRTIMVLHIVLNLIAFGMALYLCFKIKHPRLLLIHLASILILLSYSAKNKRQAFFGNLLIALLSALSVLTPMFYAQISLSNKSLIVQYGFFYCFFAFMLTWIREIIKDLEDIKGDKLDGCKTMPIVYGIQFSKRVLFVLLGITLLGATYFFLNCSAYYSLFNWIFILSILPALVYLGFWMYKSNKHRDYKVGSRIVKIIIFVGIIYLCLLQK
jgi:4-hydroxybenzoate polyprenyltransferase